MYIIVESKRREKKNEWKKEEERQTLRKKKSKERRRINKGGWGKEIESKHRVELLILKKSTLYENKFI